MYTHIYIYIYIYIYTLQVLSRWLNKSWAKQWFGLITINYKTYVHIRECGFSRHSPDLLKSICVYTYQISLRPLSAASPRDSSRGEAHEISYPVHMSTENDAQWLAVVVSFQLYRAHPPLRQECIHLRMSFFSFVGRWTPFQLLFAILTNYSLTSDDGDDDALSPILVEARLLPRRSTPSLPMRHQIAPCPAGTQSTFAPFPKHAVELLWLASRIRNHTVVL